MLSSSYSSSGHNRSSGLSNSKQYSSFSNGSPNQRPADDLMHLIDYAIHSMQRVGEVAQTLADSHERQTKQNKELIQINHTKNTKCGQYVHEVQTIKNELSKSKQILAEVEARETALKEELATTQSKLECARIEIGRQAKAIVDLRRSNTDLAATSGTLHNQLLAREEQARQISHQNRGPRDQHSSSGFVSESADGYSAATVGAIPQDITTQAQDFPRGPTSSQSLAVGALANLHSHRSPPRLPPPPPFGQLEEDCDCGSCPICDSSQSNKRARSSD